MSIGLLLPAYIDSVVCRSKNCSRLKRLLPACQKLTSIVFFDVGVRAERFEAGLVDGRERGRRRLNVLHLLPRHQSSDVVSHLVAQPERAGFGNGHGAAGQERSRALAA